MKIFQNKFFIICLCVAVVLCAVPSVFSIMGYRMLARDILMVAATPVRLCVSAVSGAVEGFEKYFGGVKTVNEQNEQLRAENESLRDEMERAELLEAENARLRAYLDMKNDYPSFTMVEGTVMSYASGNAITVFTLNRGTIHGVDVNMPVITERGIVGYVSEAGLNWCKVSTVIESSSSVGAYIPRSGVTGIVSGDYSMTRDGTCRLSYVEPDADIQIGDRVLSSGTGSVYPGDLVIGSVTAVEIDEYSRTLIATVKPEVDFSELRHMMIVTDFE